MSKVSKTIELGLLLIATSLLFNQSAFAQTPISYGGNVSGAISTPTEKDEFTFYGTSGEVVNIRFAKVSGNITPSVKLFNPSGAQIASSIMNSISVTLSATGTFKITVEDFGNNDTGNYNLNLQKINNPVGATTVNFDETFSGTLNAFAKILVYKFSVTANDKVFINFAKLDTTSGILDPYCELYNSSGASITTTIFSPFTATISYTGDVYLFVRDFGYNGTGAIEITLQRANNAANPIDLSFEVFREDTLDAITKVNAYRFNVNAGQTITLCSDIKSTTSGSFSLYMELYDTAGSRLVNTNMGNFKQAFTNAGTYYLFIYNVFDNGTGIYKFILKNGDFSCLTIDFIEPEVSLIKPKVGEIIENGSTYTITWDSSDNVGITNQEIRLSTDGGLAYPTVIASGLDESVQSYNWLIPVSLSTNKGRIKIIAQDSQANRGEDTNKSDFIIIKTSLPSDAKEISYEYDSLNRLSKTISSVVPSLTYIYDALGNRLNLAVSGLVNKPPQTGTVTPSSGTSISEQVVSFTTTYLDPDGWQDIALAKIIINTSASGLNCFYAHYDQNTNKLYLRNDSDNAWLGGISPGSNNILENSYAKLYCADTTVSGNSATLAINWKLSFKSTFLGTKNIYLYVTDDVSGSAGWNKVGSWTINKDTTAPTGSIKINNDATYTNSTTVTLNLSATDTGSGVAEMKFSNNKSRWSNPEPYAATKNWTLTSSSGKKTVYVKFKDNAGNWSKEYSDTITLDTTRPTGRIKINNNASKTNSTQVTLSLSARDSYSGVCRMQFSNDNSTWSNPEPYQTTKSWILTSGSGTKKVYVKFKDNAGNWSNTYSDTIILQ